MPLKSDAENVVLHVNLRRNCKSTKERRRRNTELKRQNIDKKMMRDLYQKKRVGVKSVILKAKTECS